MNPKIGDTLEQQSKYCKNPHLYEGGIYQEKGGEYLMFCQVGYHKFALINLEDGNRMDDPIAEEHDDLLYPSTVLLRMVGQLEEPITMVAENFQSFMDAEMYKCDS